MQVFTSFIAIGFVPAMSEKAVALKGQVISVKRKEGHAGHAYVHITEQKKIVYMSLGEEHNELTYDDYVLIQQDGTFEHVPCFETMSTASTNLEAADVCTQEQCFEESSAQGGRGGGFPVGEPQREVLDSLGLTYCKVKTLGGTFADLTESEDPEEEYAQYRELRDTVLEDTGAESLAYSGTTTNSADATVFKALVFSCGDLSCSCQGKEMFTLNHLMPTQVGNTTKDLCIVAFNKQMGEQMGEPISKKAFQMSVAAMRTGEKYAVTVSFVLVSVFFFALQHGLLFFFVNMKSVFLMCLSSFLIKKMCCVIFVYRK